MEPASSIIKALGGPNVVSAALGIHRVTVSKWMRPREKGGTGGVVPYQQIEGLLSHAARIGVPLTPADFAIRPKSLGAAAPQSPVPSSALPAVGSFV